MPGIPGATGAPPAGAATTPWRPPQKLQNTTPSGICFPHCWQNRETPPGISSRMVAGRYLRVVLRVSQVRHFPPGVGGAADSDGAPLKYVLRRRASDGAGRVPGVRLDLEDGPHRVLRDRRVLPVLRPLLRRVLPGNARAGRLPRLDVPPADDRAGLHRPRVRRRRLAAGARPSRVRGLGEVPTTDQDGPHGP